MSEKVIYHNLTSAKKYSEIDKTKAVTLSKKFWSCAEEVNPSNNALITALMNIATQIFFLYGASGAPKETVLHDIEMLKRDIIEGLEILNKMKEEVTGDE